MITPEQAYEAFRSRFGDATSKTDYVWRWNLTPTFDVAMERRSGRSTVWLPWPGSRPATLPFARHRTPDDRANSNIYSKAPSLKAGEILEAKLENESQLNAVLQYVAEATGREVEDFVDDRFSDLPVGDERLRALASVIMRPGQTAFRDALLRHYGVGCQISGCEIGEIINACHLIPASDRGIERPDNGILLRVDLHVLFDADLIAINPEGLRVHVHPTLRETDYWDFDGTTLRVAEEHRPSIEALRVRWANFVSAGGVPASRPVTPSA